jgi:outer membrane protein
MDRNGYVKEIVQMENKVDADSLAYFVAHRKYEEGMLSAIDLHTTSSTLLQSKITLLQKRMLFVLKDKLIDYYKGKELY